ncbi:MAG: hypothetical protein NXI19_15795 [Alphaproteobacteria bacterium]|nr:hypothetical protein [Alphaproteobacteria bacterium]
MAFLLGPGDLSIVAAEAQRRGISVALEGKPKATAAAGPRHLVALGSMLDDASEPLPVILSEALSGALGDPILLQVLEGSFMRLGDQISADEARSARAPLDARLSEMKAIDRAMLADRTRTWLAELRDRHIGDIEVAYVTESLARSWLAHGDVERARRLAKTAIKADPSWTTPRSTLAQIEAEGGHWHEAAAAIPDDMIETLPSSGLAFLLRMRSLADDREGTVALLDQVVARDEDDLVLMWEAADGARRVGWNADLMSRRFLDCAAQADLSGVLDHLSQISAGGHRPLNDKVVLQSVLRRAGLSDVQPETYLLPEERSEAEKGLRLGGAERWILKPASLFGGKGIQMLTQGAEGVPDIGPAVLQRYVEPPWLVDGHKAHVRTYLLVLPGPRRGIWMSMDGPARLSPLAWSDGGHGADLGAHVTNTNLHWDRPDLLVEQDPEQDNKGHVRRMARVLDGMAAERPESVPVARLQAFCKRLVEGLSAELHQPMAGLLALDLMFDADGRPWVLEVESRPQISAGGVPLVGRLHARLGREALPILSAYLEGRDPPEVSGDWQRILR